MAYWPIVGHIAKASKVALQIEQARVPIAAAVLRTVGDADALQCALSGGDDYQLAFTIAASYLEALQQRFTAVQVIGRVSAGQGVQLLDSAGQSMQVRPSWLSAFSIRIKIHAQP